MRAFAPRLSGARQTTSGVASICRSINVVTPRMHLPSVSVSGSREFSASWAASRSNRPNCERLVRRAGATAVLSEVDDVGVSDAADAVIRYAINLARASETYEVHSWMVLLGILRYESCAAAQILTKLGLEDLYGAWNEVLWALNVCDGLKRRGFNTEIQFADRAFKVITAASDFAAWHGKDKVYSEDLLMALAAGDVLEGLFPDLNLSFDRVRKAVEKHTGRRYLLPDETAGEQPGPLKSEDDVSFL